MISHFSSWVRKQPVLAFYVLAFSITWIGWVPQAAHSQGLFPFDSPIFYILGGVGPLLAVFIVTKAITGKDDYGELFRPLWQWRAGFVWYFVAMFGYAVIWLATSALSGTVLAEFAQLGTPLALLSSFLVYLLAAIPEEIAWRGFALPRLQSRFSALAASLIVGFLWALWHLPLLLNTDNVMSTYPIHLFIFEVMVRSIIYTWIYNSTRGSLLFVTLFHAASNTVGTTVGGESLTVHIAAAALLILVFGVSHLSYRCERQVQKDLPKAAAQGV